MLRAEDRHGVQMRERGGGRRIREVVGRHVDGLDGGNGALVGRGNALLEGAQVGRQGRLVADGTGDAAEQGRHLGARPG